MGYLTSLIPGIIGMGAGVATANPWLVGGSMLGTMKGLSDQSNAQDMRKANAEITRYSPWTGMQGQTVGNANQLGDVVQGAAGGMAMGQNYDKFNMDMKNSQAMLDAQNAKAATGNEYTSTGGVTNNPAAASSMSQGLKLASQSPYSLPINKGSAGAVQGAGNGIDAPGMSASQMSQSGMDPWTILQMLGMKQP